MWKVIAAGPVVAILAIACSPGSLEVESGGGSVEGVVRRAGNAAEGAEVYLCEGKEDTFYYSPCTGARAELETDAEGRFRFESIKPGEYFLLVHSGGWCAEVGSAWPCLDGNCIDLPTVSVSANDLASAGSFEIDECE